MAKKKSASKKGSRKKTVAGRASKMLSDAGKGIASAARYVTGTKKKKAGGSRKKAAKKK